MANDKYGYWYAIPVGDDGSNTHEIIFLNGDGTVETMNGQSTEEMWELVEQIPDPGWNKRVLEVLHPSICDKHTEELKQLSFKDFMARVEAMGCVHCTHEQARKAPLFGTRDDDDDFS